MKERKLSQLWYVDNGSSNRMTGDKSKFSKLDQNVTREVKFGDGLTLRIQGKGSISFKCKTGEAKVFDNVFYIPTLCNNIVSPDNCQSKEIRWYYMESFYGCMTRTKNF